MQNMKSWHLFAVFSISLIMVLGIQSSAFADSEDGSKSCPFKGDKENFEKTEVDFSTKNSDKVTHTSFEEKQVPSWLKSNAKWWSTGQLNDSEFASGIKFLIESEIIYIPDNQISVGDSEVQTPVWVKTTAGWWSDGLVSDTEFVSGLQHLVNIGII